MCTAILSALPEEQATLLEHLQHPQRQMHAGRAFWTGVLEGRCVVLALSGMGKVAAATTATALIERFAAARIVFTGLAGGLGHGVRVGDLVVAREYLQHDMDASPLAPRWVVPGYRQPRMACDVALTALLWDAAQGCAAATGVGAHHGLIASGDQFIASADAAQRLHSALADAGHDVLAVEMEGAAVAQVCADYGVPFAAVRTISDRADDDAHVDFLQFVQNVACRNADAVLREFMRLLSK